MAGNQSKNPVIFGAVILSFAWNLVLLFGVVLDLDLVETRAAGGQFIQFPTEVRIAYLLQSVLVIYQIWIFKCLYYAESIRFKCLPRFFLTIGIIGILLNALSRSANERWNVIPGAIISWAFWYYGLKKN
jgi:hypothetical protein